MKNDETTLRINLVIHGTERQLRVRPGVGDRGRADLKSERADHVLATRKALKSEAFL